MNTKVTNTAMAQQVSLQGGGIVLLDGATIDGQIPGDGRILVSKLNAPLGYTIPQPPQEFPRDLLTVYIVVQGNPTKIPLMTGHPLGPIADRDWSKEFFIPVAELKELPTPEAPTVYELIYEFIANGANPSPPASTEYRIDRTAPYRVKNPPSNLSPSAISFPTDLPPSQKIDDTYLGLHPNGIDITITLAANYDPTDVCDIYFGNPSDPAYATPVMTNVAIPATGIINIPLAILQGLNEGLNTITVIYKDLAGNISLRSKPEQRTVERLAPPVPLEPVVPLADGTGGDDLIDVADCVTGVTVEVTVPLPSTPTDSIRCYWGNTLLVPEKPVGNNTLLVFDVDYSVIKAEYGVTDVDVPTTARYEMFRQGVLAPIATHSTSFKVNIYQPGGPNPDEPSDVNPNFKKPRLVSSQGVDNKLDDNDHGNNADIFVELLATPPAASGQFIRCFYDGVALTPDYYLSPGDEGKDIKMAEVPWSLIELKPNGTIPIKWTLFEVQGPNPVSSLDEDVDVDITKIDLPKPVVDGLIFDNISCPTLNFVPPGDGTSRRNLKVLVPFSPSMVTGRDVELTWEGFTDQNTSNPIAGTKVSVTLPVPNPAPATGMEFFIGDYLKELKPVSDGYGKLFYTISTVTPESEPAVHFVFLEDNNGDYCEVANPLP
ncbi:hypothetical protein [Pseudomonas sp. COW5]|uniref:hypothetical protein n=1 Tax=Pseudomonas sp. COW5 TaxID=2981253 RepID=UPI002245D3E0|nr:hypothetical protein [Pseudomonas sp. COW5]MCX2546180.1 hypothetical protein [Pseudomonas sp. COW5]